MHTRRSILLASLGMALLPAPAIAGATPGNRLSWAEFRSQMFRLARDYSSRAVSGQETSSRGLQLLQRLDVRDEAFQAAVGNAYESGNRFWLWQRLEKDRLLAGGILNIERNSDVPLHDHPGATGMIRMLSGEAEVWQFDRSAMHGSDNGVTTLKRVMHRTLGPGDIAVLSPEYGNIHALRSRTQTCRMLDYFIPPYVRRERSWFIPEHSDWQSNTLVTCQHIPEQEFDFS